jgi:hypothetical protein
VKFTNLDPSLMLEVPVINLTDKNISQEKLIEILSKDVVILRNFEVVMGINSSLFDPTNLAKYYGEEIVDIVT